jgi:hypothetical protein
VIEPGAVDGREGCLVQPANIHAAHLDADLRPEPVDLDPHGGLPPDIIAPPGPS